MKRNEKLLVLMISIVFLFLLLGAGELYCRLFTRINTFGISSDLFVPNRFGNSPGNLPNGAAMAFGVMCHTDENGFRVDPVFKDTYYDTKIFFFGDSVGFGVGVPEQHSAIGRLRRALPGVRLYNSSCIGYWAKDYKNVTDFFLSRHPEMKTAYAIMCLNDIYDESAIKIRDVFQNESQQDMQKNIATKIMKFGFMHDVNAWLRSRSKLYILLKNKIEDTSLRVFLYDLSVYKKSGGDFDTNMSAFTQVNDQLKKAGIKFKVVIIPYEVQLRSRNNAFMAPQNMIKDYFVKHGVDFIDSTECFRNAGIAPAELYLFGDPMHLSSTGHRVLCDILNRDITNTEHWNTLGKANQ